MEHQHGLAKAQDWQRWTEQSGGHAGLRSSPTRRSPLGRNGLEWFQLPSGSPFFSVVSSWWNGGPNPWHPFYLPYATEPSHLFLESCVDTWNLPHLQEQV